MDIEQKRQLLVQAILNLTPDQLEGWIEDNLDLYEVVYNAQHPNVEDEEDGPGFDCGFEDTDDEEDEDYNIDTFAEEDDDEDLEHDDDFGADNGHDW